MTRLVSSICLYFVCLCTVVLAGAEAKKVYDEANSLLDRIIDEKLLTASGVVAFYPAQSDGDDIVLYEDLNAYNAATPLTRLYGLRQQVGADNSLSLACLISLPLSQFTCTFSRTCPAFSSLISFPLVFLSSDSAVTLLKGNLKCM